MSNVPFFLLDWLKENLEHYQFVSQEAKELKEKIKTVELKQDEKNIEGEQYYWEFIEKLESNPFTTYTRKGEEASILTNDFYYYFFPVADDEQLCYPMALYLKMGSLDSQEKASVLNQRITLSMYYWQSEKEEKEKEKKKRWDRLRSESAGIIERYGSLLNKTVFQFVVLEILLLCMLVLVGVKIVRIINSNWNSLQNYNDLRVVSLWICAAVTLLYLIKCLLFLFREKKRSGLIKVWKAKDMHEKEKSGKIIGFRSQEGLKQILQQMLFEKNYLPRNQIMPIGTELNENHFNLNDFLNKGNEKILNTVRPIHILVICLTAICVFLAYPEGMPESVIKWQNMGTLFLKKGISSVYRSEASQDEVEYLQNEVGEQLVGNVKIYSKSGETLEGEVIHDNDSNTTVKVSEGDRIEIKFDSKKTVSCLQIKNGTVEDDMSGGVRKALISFGGDKEYSALFNWQEEGEESYILPPGYMNVDTLTIEVQDIFGEYASIAELNVYS